MTKSENFCSNLYNLFMADIADNFLKTIRLVAEKLKDYQYAFRGTTSLVLQGISMNVDDIDVLTDKDTALACNQIFSDFIKTKVEYKRSDKFKSYFGSFEINQVLVEIMGNWQIKTKGDWSRIYSASAEEKTQINLGDIKVFVTKIELELEFFAQMGRWTAYHKIKNQLQNKNQIGLF